MPDELKPNESQQKDAHRKERLFDQAEVNYATVSMQAGKACAGCRWFNSYGNEWSDHPQCHLVESWPLPIESTGYCDRYEAFPMPQPITETPMPVVIVEPTEVDAAGEAALKDKALFDRIWDGVQQRLGLKSDGLTTGFKVAGNHWLAVWSNNFKDRDGELFTAQACEDYAARVDMGVVPKPELWVWHAGKQVAIGAAHWVGTHGHFLMAAGEFYGADAAQTAKAFYAKHAKETGISHGYTFLESAFDGKAYHQFNTFEISLLPRGAEANWYTSLEGVKAMALSAEKQQYLETVFGKDHAARILADWDKRGKALEEVGVEFKDFTGTDLSAANKAAVDAAERSLKELFPDLVEGSAEAVVAAAEALKAAKAEKQAREGQDAKIAALEKDIDALRAEMNLRPRSASRAAETVLESTDGKGKELLDTVHQQMVERDGFWGTEVVKAPDGK